MIKKLSLPVLLLLGASTQAIKMNAKDDVLVQTEGVPTPTENPNSPENYKDDGLDEEAYA
jgi:hypothetical protein